MNYKVSLKAAIAELVATCLFVWGVITALAFGLAITVLAYATAHLSGGQMNPAVTLGLALVGSLGTAQAAANMIAQASQRGCAAVGVVSVVLETVVNKKSVVKAQAPLAIGFAVFCAHAVMLPLDGCSINPARSLGPAIVSGTWPGTFWVFIVGPFVGALFACPLHMFFRSDWDTVRETPQEPAVGIDAQMSGELPQNAAPHGPASSTSSPKKTVSESMV
ncbi:plasma membrane intrinsic [Micractinium conductrix]|uniref:Plasma membrane intrinsic n=1 Tax=Micractinium conductrix TaxID=554055 RepID=A0A2P6VR91_9CHLO|nr:plasma membrane intrinsic [Micractinium conductrix]|eukprot:PSC76585.1 plasma membrane intrinsic [Micractinium conductrix]